ncbi:hypothetical protein TNIN_237991 [Trichonephila inaurata madagascariensis]|uniref:Uncharacterized protein n=1 Tax=Trichonephila inaurata madagascariensis TaxID=2747483 RepID=A0A8X7BY11_9ARAC|nr:hypothetical protein TNIN_237991 [Trichonephila inaurata madagascariensis]
MPTSIVIDKRTAIIVASGRQKTPHMTLAKASHDTKVRCGRMVRVHCFIPSQILPFARVTPQGLTIGSVNGERYREMLQSYVIPTTQQ